MNEGPSSRGDRREGDGWEGWVGGMAPVQGRGVVDGLPWDFRARGDSWGMTIAEQPTDDPDAVGHNVPGWVAEGDYGSGVDASTMPLDSAWALITEAIERFRRGLLPHVAAGDQMPPR